MSQSNQTIFIMTSVHPWDDPRIFFKEAISLTKKFRVEIHAPAEFKRREENGVIIKGLPKYQRRYQRCLNWVRLFFRAWKSPAKYIHFHDPELIPLCFLLKLLLGKKVIYDVHENFPASILTKSWIPRCMRKGLSRFFNFWEVRAAGYFSGIILAEYSYLQRFRHLPILVQPIVNYPPLNMGQKAYRDAAPCGERGDIRKNGEKKNQVKFIYVGVISSSRGIEEIIRGFALVKKMGFAFHLFLVGSWINEDLREQMEELIRNTDIARNVTITGKVSFNRLGSFYNQCDVGLALLHPEKNYVNSIATKIFEYMAAGMPVLASDFPLWKLLISGHQCGLTVNPLDTEKISEKLSLFIRDQSLRRRLGNNGFKAFRSNYNWMTQEEKLREFYSKLE